jgi:site-specific DNA recombinase
MIAETTKLLGRTQAKGNRAKPYGGYIRVSRVGERDERLRSPDFQAAGITAKAKAEGVPVELFEPELDVSGSKRARAILDGIVARIEAGELAGIVVYNISRLSRLKPLDRIELVERIEAAGGRIVSCSESFDPATPEGRFVRDLFFSLARLEWEQKAEQFQLAKDAAVARGAKISKTANFGYRFGDGHVLAVDDVEAAVVVELFEGRRGGRSFGELAQLFEERTGRPTAPQTIAELLRNRVYLGEVHYGGGDSPVLVNRSAHDAIVSVELFDAVQAVNEERSSGPGSGGRAKALLAGIATCAGCGRTLGRSTATGPSRPFYKCSAPTGKCSARASIGEDVLDSYVTAAVLEELGPTADVLVELELELGASTPRIVIEHRLAEARRALVSYEADVERELRVGAEAFEAGTKARVELVAKLEAELEQAGAESAIEIARTTLRAELESELDRDDEIAVAERRRLLAIAIGELVVRKTPFRGAPAAARVELAFAGSAPSPLGEDRAELLEELVADGSRQVEARV